MPMRPTSGQSPRRAVNTKISDSVRARLEAAARASDRTLSHEIEYRLEQSMREESRFGDPETADVLRELAEYIGKAERLNRRKLLDPIETNPNVNFDGHIRWILGQIISFRRAMRAPVDFEVIEKMDREDSEANDWTDDDGTAITVDMPKAKSRP